MSDTPVRTMTAIYMNPAERRLLEEIAKSEALTKSAFMRRLLLQYAKAQGKQCS